MSSGFGLPIVNFSALGELGKSFGQGYDRAQAPELIQAYLQSQGAPMPLSALGAGAAPNANAQQPLPMLGQAPATALPSFADTTSPSGGYVASLFKRESNNNPNAQASTSSAKGLGQFTDRTWAGVMRSHPELGLTADGRTDPDQMLRATNAFTADNERGLQRAGLPVNDATRYASHFLGASGGPRFVAGTLRNPDVPAANYVQPDQVAANRRIFFNRDGTPKTAGQVMNDFGSSFGGGSQQVATAEARPQRVAYADNEDQTQALEQRMGMMPPARASAPSMPTQVAQAPAGDPRADMPMEGAQTAEFYIPGTEPAPVPDFPPGRVRQSGLVSPATSMPSTSVDARHSPVGQPLATNQPPQIGLPAVRGAQGRPVDSEMLGRMLENQYTAPIAQQIIASQLKTGDDYAFTAVGDQFYRTNKRTGSVELVPGVTKPQTTVVSPGGTLVDQVTGRPIYSAPAKPETLAPGSTVYDPATNKGLFTAPEKSSKPSFVQMNGRLLLTDPDTGAARDVTPADLPQGYRPASAEERKAYGVNDTTPLAIGPDGKPQSLGGQTINVNPGERAGDAAIGADYGKRFVEYQRDGVAASGSVGTIATMERAMNSPGFYSGTGGPARLSFNRALESFGIKDKGKASPAEVFDALSNKVILDGLGGSLGAGISNGDRDFIQRTAPDLAKTPEGNRQLLGMARALAERRQAIAKLSRDYAKANGGRLDAGFDERLSEWAATNPLFGTAPTGGGQPAVPQRSAPAQAAPQSAAPISDLEAEARRRGLIR